MIKKLNKKSVSNILFVLVLVLMLYPPTREWFMRQIAFSPGIESVGESNKLQDYDWRLNGLNTTDVDFNSFKNEVVFVNFWATWCPPCRAEMPMIQEFYDTYKNRVKFVFVTSENWSTVKTYFDKNNYNLPVYNALTRPPESFTKTNSIPASYLISRQGEIRISKVGAANWNSAKVAKLVDALLAD